MNNKIRGTIQKVVDRVRIQKRRLLGSRKSILPLMERIPPQKGGSSTGNSLVLEATPQPELGVLEELIPTSDVPLFLQTDEQWANLPYGTDGQKNIAENGCAVVTLAMLGNFYGMTCTPEDVQLWAKNDYYLYITGTSWNIFEDFASSHNLTCNNLGDDIDAVVAELEQGHLVVASLKEGRFTDVGHMILLTGYQNGKISMNDPNDDEKKLHRYQWFAVEEIAESGLNYWAIHPGEDIEQTA